LLTNDEPTLVTTVFGTRQVWDAKTGAGVLTLNVHTAFVWSASFSPDGTRIRALQSLPMASTKNRNPACRTTRSVPRQTTEEGEWPLCLNATMV
jgi:WD40 repeat protein